ncbi:MAG: sulfatase, partial [Gemmatimonadetes bacterium]|nr:sulfatase [Gemmatimonadota bacterium]
DGPWLLYDNERDPYQLENLVDSPDAADLLKELDQRLSTRLALMGDEFLPGDDYLHQWGYQVDEKGTVPYRN